LARLRFPFPAGRRAAVGLASVLALGACAPVGPNFAPPKALSLAETYRPAAEANPDSAAVSSAQLAADWRRVFPSAKLDALIATVLAGNLELKGADASLIAAQAERRSALSAFLPEVDANGGVARERLNLASFGFSGGGFPNNPQFSLYSVGATASYPLDLFGGLRREAESAKARREAAVRQRDAAWLAVTGQAATEAVAIAVVRAELAELDAILADDRKTVELADQAERAGGEAHRSTVTARAQLAADETLSPALRHRLAVARHALAALAGRAPADWSPPDFGLEDLTLPAKLPVALPSQLVHTRPDILAAEARLHAATADLGVATAKLYPSLSLSAQVTQGALAPEHLFDWTYAAASLGAGLTGPVFDGGRRRAGVRAADARLQGAAAAYQSTVVNAFTQVADLMSALDQDQATLAAEQRAEDLAAETLRLARLAYTGGATGLPPVIDAQRQLSNARLSLVRAEGQLRLDAIALFVATGRGLSRSDAEGVTEPRKSANPAA